MILDHHLYMIVRGPTPTTLEADFTRNVVLTTEVQTENLPSDSFSIHGFFDSRGAHFSVPVTFSLYVDRIQNGSNLGVVQQFVNRTRRMDEISVEDADNTGETL